jgi:hypothetical protein
VNAPVGRNENKEAKMKFMLIQNYAPTEVVSEPMSSWAPEDVKAHRRPGWASVAAEPSRAMTDELPAFSRS